MANYSSGESGELVSSTAESFRGFMSEITNLEYTIVKSREDFPPPADNSKWYLYAQGEPSAVNHARLLWIARDELILIQSMSLGDTSDWIYSDYGEKAVAVSANPGDSDLRLVRQYLIERFPLVDQRLDAYQKILDDVSSKYGIKLAIRVQGDTLLATFFVVAKIEGRDLKENQRPEAIRRNLKGLKEAWDRISEDERKRLR